MSDQGVFRSNGVPYLFLSCGRWPHYHARTDTPNRLNYRKMHRIAAYLTTIVDTLCRAAFDKLAEPVDPVAFEIATLERALEIAKEKLHYVYLGNVGVGDSNTYCPTNGNLLVRRVGYSSEVVGIEDGKCSECGRPVDFLWCDE